MIRPNSVWRMNRIVVTLVWCERASGNLTVSVHLEHQAVKVYVTLRQHHAMHFIPDSGHWPRRYIAQLKGSLHLSEPKFYVVCTHQWMSAHADLSSHGVRSLHTQSNWQWRLWVSKYTTICTVYAIIMRKGGWGGSKYKWSICQAAVAVYPWGSSCILATKCSKTYKDRSILHCRVVTINIAR